MIQQIKLKNFRKFKELDLNTNNSIVIFSGANAIGKTSVLESIYLVSTSKSHRTNDLENLICTNEEFTIVEIQANKKYKTILSKDGKKNFINNVEFSKVSDFIGNLKVVMLSPHDIDLIQGSKGTRRRFLDLEISLLDKTYLRSLTVYKKLLKERNEILKSYQNDNQVVLNIVTDQLIEQLQIIYKIRMNFINDLNNNLKKIASSLNCENINLEYVSTYDSEDLKKSFLNKQSYDIVSKTTNIGIHRDDFKILINGKDAIEYASEGQKKTIVLAIKLALKDIYLKIFKEEPILLLDDIFAALDSKRMNNIMSYIKNNSQTFITTTSIFNIPDELLKDALVIRL